MKSMQEQLQQEVCGRMKSMLEDIKPLFKVMKEMEDFKEKTVVHQVSFTTQIKALHSEIETLKKVLNETSVSLRGINEKIEKMNPVTEADEDASDQERITNHAQNSPRVY